MTSGLLIPELSEADASRLRNARMPIVVSTYYDLGHHDQMTRFNAFMDTLKRQEPFAGSYPLIVVDASPEGSHAHVAAVARCYGAVFIDARGHGGLARQNLIGLTTAFRYCECAGRMEGEKSDLSRAVSYDEIYGRLQSGVDLVCVGRDAEAMATLPAEQRVVEQAMNHYGAEVYDLLSDPSCGPRFLSRQAMDLLAEFDIAKYPQWEWQLGLLMDLMVRGRRVEQATCSLQHPPAIRELEEGDPQYVDKRKRQGAAMLAFINNYAAEIGLPIRVAA